MQQGGDDVQCRSRAGRDPINAVRCAAAPTRSYAGKISEPDALHTMSREEVFSLKPSLLRQLLTRAILTWTLRRIEPYSRRHAEP